MTVLTGFVKIRLVPWPSLTKPHAGTLARRPRLREDPLVNHGTKKILDDPTHVKHSLA